MRSYIRVYLYHTPCSDAVLYADTFMLISPTCRLLLTTAHAQCHNHDQTSLPSWVTGSNHADGTPCYAKPYALLNSLSLIHAVTPVCFRARGD